MKWFWILLMIAFMVLFSFLLKKANYRNQKKTNDYTIKQPYWYLYVGIFGLVAFNLIGFIFLIEQKEIDSWICMLLISIPYIFIIMYERNWKVEFDDDYFIFTNIWRVKKKYLYEQIEILSTGRSIKIYYKKRKIISISTLIINSNELERKIYKYKKSIS